MVGISYLDGISFSRGLQPGKSFGDKNQTLGTAGATTYFNDLQGRPDYTFDTWTGSITNVIMHWRMAT
jgi:hypothetical protein